MLLEDRVVAHGGGLERRQEPRVRHRLAGAGGQAGALVRGCGQKLEDRDAGQRPERVAVDDRGDGSIQVDPRDAHVSSSARFDTSRGEIRIQTLIHV